LEINEQHIELFDAYILKQLAAKERENFEQKLLTDAVFNLQFEQYKLLVLGIQDFGKSQLKTFLKAQPKPEIKTINLWKKPLAIAASLALLMVLGILLKNNFLPKKEEIAIKENPRFEEIKPKSLDTNQIQLIEIEAIKKEQVQDKNEEKESIAPMAESKITEIDDANFNTSKIAPSPITKAEVIEVENYKILSEKKIKDTILFVQLLASNFDSDDKMVRKTNESDVLKNKKSKSPTLPSSVNSNTSPTDNNNNRLDSISFKNLEKTKALKPSKYYVEFWQSPLNFKGYKFVENTIQLYGLADNKIKIYQLNNVIYLKHNTQVYALNYCTDACMYKTEVNAEIVNYINSQP